MAESLKQHCTFGDAVLTTGPQQSINRHMHTRKHPYTYAHICISLRLCNPLTETQGNADVLRRPSKRVRVIGQRPAGSLYLPLEDQGRLKLPGLLSLPRYPPPLPAHCIRTLKKNLEEQTQSGGLESRLFYNDVRDLGG